MKTPLQKKSRKGYKWGAKDYLSSFTVGEIRVFNEDLSWPNLMVIANYMKRNFGCRFVFNTHEGERLIIRVK